MILLDTNVISEPWKPAPDIAVLTWLDAQAIENAIHFCYFDCGTSFRDCLNAIGEASDNSPRSS